MFDEKSEGGVRERKTVFLTRWNAWVLCLVVRVLVHVLQENGLAKGGLVVQTRAAVAMTASTNLEVEGTVDSERVGGRTSVPGTQL